MDVTAFHRGESEALAEVIDRCGPWVWALVRRGFVCEDSITIGSERTSIRVLGAPNHDAAVDITVRALAAALTPAARAALQTQEEIDTHLLEVARDVVFRAAERAGRLLGLGDPEVLSAVPVEVEDLDTLMAVSERPSLTEFPLDDESKTTFVQLRDLRDAFVRNLDERSTALVEARFEGDHSLEALARSFDCGKAAVLSRERRVRRALQRTLQAALHRSVGPFEAEAALSGSPETLMPCGPTWEQVRREVQTRTFAAEPAPFGRRLAWAVAALAVGLLGWVGLFTGWLPSPDDDVYPAPSLRVVCDPVCIAGAEAQISVLAPQDARRFGVALTSTTGDVRPFLVAPDGGSLRLPLGARTRSLVVPHVVRIPDDLPPGTVAVAVFSEEKLRSGDLLDLAAGRAAREGVLTTTVAVIP